MSETGGGRILTLCAIGSAANIHVQNRTRCFAGRGHRVCLISDSPGEIEGVEVLAPRSPANPIRRLIAQLVDYHRMLRRADADIYHVHFAWYLRAWMALLLDCRPLVVSLMGSDIFYKERRRGGLFSRWLTRELLRQADLITAKSNHIITAVNGLIGQRPNVTRVIWGVDPAQFHRQDASELRQQLGLTPDQFVILFPKSLIPFYQSHLVIAALRNVVQTHPEVRLLITDDDADPAYKSQLLDQIEQLGLGGYVRLIDAVPHSAMPLYHSLADLVVAMPLSDGLPQALFEAMACETPSMLPVLPNYAEIVTHGENAYLVDYDPESIAAGINRLIEDRALYGDIVRKGLETVRREASFPDEVSRVEAMYYDLLDSPLKKIGLLRKLLIGTMVGGYVVFEKGFAALFKRSSALD
jgi:glycosyltransferase involved in cell wall biosynthesis